MTYKFLRIFLSLTFPIFVPVSLVAADVSLSVSPIRVEHRVIQGERGTDMISVANEGSAPTRLKVSIEDWILSKEGSPVFMKAGGNPYSCVEWIRINPVDFRVSPGQTREVRYTITVPQGIPDGGYRAALIFGTAPDAVPGEKNRSVQVTGRIVTIVYVVVGKPSPAGHADGLKTTLRKDGVDFLLSLRNTGKVHFRTKGSLTVKDSNGQKVLDVGIPDVPVLPESEREIKISSGKSLPKGSYSVLAVIDIGNKDLIGAEATFTVE
jgi:P pilus assembly chaperone PapD